MKPRKSTKTWQTTRKPNLLRHKSGRYYARAFAGGKEVSEGRRDENITVSEIAVCLRNHRHSPVSVKADLENGFEKSLDEQEGCAASR